MDEKIGSFDSARSYGRYLSGLYSFRHPIEEALEKVEWPKTLGAWRPTCVSGAIRADLGALGLKLAAGLKRHGGFGTSSSLFGCLYVLEGSGFGARILLKRAHALGLTESFGASHLAAQASSGGWGVFVSALEGATDLNIEVAATAAIETFAAAEAAFAEL
ncbi:biliverdin-producing heme oxygenase [Mesorhizobium sp. CU2]|uniref:biliverdin-producing heme oxygenase n=1 Tax=unclassified Mesorhizobium TaxID=325217 RepID=UPI00112B161C|nr:MULTISPECIES: biliverdin-producing heme oxygenase [unclassified Mesorhizobium]TPN80711.1 biliverdin-producing heme oxygenase [Mesorhizobium sp. CU3]TPO10187.1 biliverdin-producing heme oxygenase [Mesorhizobium sp. CU2]